MRGHSWVLNIVMNTVGSICRYSNANIYLLQHSNINCLSLVIYFMNITKCVLIRRKILYFRYVGIVMRVVNLFIKCEMYVCLFNDSWFLNRWQEQSVLYSLILTLNKPTIILNLPGFRSTLLTNDKYVMNSSYVMTNSPLVSSSLYFL